MLIDTHCHLDFSAFDNDREEVIARAVSDKIEALINIGSSPESNARSRELAAAHDKIFFSIGIHPHYADCLDHKELKEGRLFGIALGALNENKKLVAIGEVGLDYYKSTVDARTQKETFRAFIGIARQSGLPLVIHARESQQEVLAILKEELGNLEKVVFHCFSGPASFLEQCLQAGAMISYTATITYPKAAALRELVKQTPLERILLETDAPYLAPQAHRGKRNEPAYVHYVAQEVAALKQKDIEDVARQTTANARRFFNLDKKQGNTA